MRDIALVMPTADRAPRTNYLAQTLANLTRAGVFQSARLHSFHLVDSGVVTDEALWPDRALDGFVESLLVVYRTQVRRGPAENAAAALQAGAGSGAAWVLFVEDDVDVCGDFLGSVGRWLDDHADALATVYKFTGEHVAMYDRRARESGVWRLAATQNWSTVCMGMRPDLATDLAAWLVAHPVYDHEVRPPDVAYDLEMTNWAAARGLTDFLVSSPSFCQHLGDDSAIRPLDRRVIRFPSWPGPDWQYEQQQTGGRA